jgi:hypothetical protein
MVGMVPVPAWHGSSIPPSSFDTHSDSIGSRNEIVARLCTYWLLLSEHLP